MIIADDGAVVVVAKPNALQKRAGAAGTGESKARTSEQARAAVNVRWEKKASPNKERLAEMAEGKQISMEKEKEYNSLFRFAERHGVKLSRLKLDNKIYLSVPEEWEKKLNFLKEKKGNSYYLRLSEIDNLEKVAWKAGVRLVVEQIDPDVLRVRIEKKSIDRVH